MSAGPAATRLSAVLWDMDGTLLDTEPLWDIAMGELTRRLGFEMSEELRESTLGNGMTESLTRIYAAGDIPAERQDFAGDTRWTLDRVTELFSTGVPWRPGAIEALELLAGAQVPTALVTNTVREITEMTLETLGRDRFAVTVCGDEVPEAKPAPDPYLRAADLLGLPAAQCRAVEDSPTGTLAATAAGCPTLVVPSQSPVPEGPGRTFRSSLVGVTLDELLAAPVG